MIRRIKCWLGFHFGPQIIRNGELHTYCVYCGAHSRQMVVM